MFEHLKTLEEKYEAFVYFVATDYTELSHDKVLAQRNEYVKLARGLFLESKVQPYLEAELDELK